MAIYHLTAKTIGRNRGRTATAAAAYRAGVRIVDERTGLVFDFTRKRGVDGSELIAPEGCQPERGALWNAVERSETRKDAQVAREIEVALPRELSPQEMRSLVRTFVRDQFVRLGMIADVAFHHLTGSNPHSHIMLTMRAWTGEGFGLKQREWNDRGLCLEWREAWAQYANDALARAGHAQRIDHRSLMEQGAEAAEQNRMNDAAALDRMPTIHERGNAGAKAQNDRIRHANNVRRGDWDDIAPTPYEPLAFSTAPPVEPKTKAKRRTRAEQLTESQAVFIAEMLERRDVAARRWKQHDREATEAGEWLEAHAGVGAERLKARENAVIHLELSRVKRAEWLLLHQRPFWPWARRAWKKKRDSFQQVVNKAKVALAHADAQATPRAFDQWERTCAEKRVERDEALKARRSIAATPCEMEALTRSRIEARQTESKRGEDAPPVKSEPTHEYVPASRPRARPR